MEGREGDWDQHIADTEARTISVVDDITVLTTRLLNTAKRKTEKERLSALPQLEKASQVLARAAKVLLQELEPAGEREREVAPRAAVMSAAETVVTWCPRTRTRPKPPCGPRSRPVTTARSGHTGTGRGGGRRGAIAAVFSWSRRPGRRGTWRS